MGSTEPKLTHADNSITKFLIDNNDFDHYAIAFSSPCSLVSLANKGQVNFAKIGSQSHIQVFQNLHQPL
ncbi:hypothetical protein SPLC1_S530970 [Arthrospira platensis C1]|nr:hypothetical protein SPLC1_S530970 [Arthrospira platensis C1]